MNYYSSSIPQRLNLKDHSSMDQIRDPTRRLPPSNSIQEADIFYNHKSYQSLSQDAISTGSISGSVSRTSSIEKFGQATKNIFQAVKRGIKRFGSLRRNKSA